MTRRVFTFGYAGLTLDQFIDGLLDSQIECLIDIRELPISRKRGFAKTALSSRLAEEGIEYQHLRVLGSPTVARHRVRESKNYKQFFAAMDRHLARPAATDAIATVIEQASKLRACLMCYCPDWEKCHRKAVVEAIGRLEPISFSHIMHDVSGFHVVHEDVVRAVRTQARRAA